MMLILDDHPLVRHGLCSLIQMNRKGEEILQASTIQESIGKFKSHSIETLFVDLNLNGENGFDLLLWLRKNKILVKTFIITSSSRQSDFTYARELGVDAYLLKDAFLDEIAYSLTIVGQGGKFYSAALVEQMSRVDQESKRVDQLTNREAEVLKLVDKGYSNAEISGQLHISESTAKKHISNILAKLGLKRRTEIMAFANQNNLFSERI